MAETRVPTRWRVALLVGPFSLFLPPMEAHTAGAAAEKGRGGQSVRTDAKRQLMTTHQPTSCVTGLGPSPRSPDRNVRTLALVTTLARRSTTRPEGHVNATQFTAT